MKSKTGIAAVAALLAALAIVAWTITAGMWNRSESQPPEGATPTSKAAPTDRESPWSTERMRSAKPAPMPTR